MSDKLIKIELNENQEPIVSGRDLHEALEVKTAYKDWFPRMCKYGFVENTDFVTIAQKRATNNPKNPYTTQTNHAIKLDMAKEIAMIQRSEAGKKVRQYFIQVEKDFNSPEKIMARALKIAENSLNQLKLENKQQKELLEEQKPKVVFADAVETSDSCILIGNLAKILRQNGVDIGQNRLFEWLRNNEYLMKFGERKNMPTQKSMDLGLFEIKVSTVVNPDGSVRTTRTTKCTPKGQIYFINKFLEDTKESEVN